MRRPPANTRRVYFFEFGSPKTITPHPAVAHLLVTGVCDNPDTKFAEFQSALWSDVRYNDSVLQVEAASAALTDLQSRTSSSAVFPSPSPYPAACEGAAEYHINLGLTMKCTTTFHVDGGPAAGAANFFTHGSVSTTIDVTTSYSCPNPAGLASGTTQLSALSQVRCGDRDHWRRSLYGVVPCRCRLVST